MLRLGALPAKKRPRRSRIGMSLTKGLVGLPEQSGFEEHLQKAVQHPALHGSAVGTDDSGEYMHGVGVVAQKPAGVVPGEMAVCHDVWLWLEELDLDGGLPVVADLALIAEDFSESRLAAHPFDFLAVELEYSIGKHLFLESSSTALKGLFFRPGLYSQGFRVVDHEADTPWERKYVRRTARR